MDVLCISGNEIVQFLWDSHTDERRKKIKEQIHMYQGWPETQVPIFVT